MKKVILIIKMLYHKWIKGECRHICFRCRYGERCWRDYINNNLI